MIDRRTFLRNGLGAGAALMLAGCHSNKYAKALLTGDHSSSSHKHPNVLIINIDDMGYGDLSCNGNPVFKTPNIDKLHSQSVRLTQFHAAPLCTPTRGQLMTGVDALRNGARWVGTENTNLRADLPTMAEIFRDSGYRTGIFGKWHLGDNYPRRPQDRGFEESVWFPSQEVGTVNDHWGNDYFHDVFEHNGKLQNYDGFCTDVWFDLAMDWMGKCGRSHKPFLCYLPTNVVHTPHYVEQKYRDRINIPGLSKDEQTYFATLLNLDDNMWRLERFLESSGLRDNTIVIFISDNGGVAGVRTFNAGMRGSKNMLWEGGHRVPCFIRWPNGGLVEPCNIDGPAQMQDLLPTLLDLCSIKESDAHFDGISLARQLRGKEQMPDRMFVVQCFVKPQKWDACVIWGPWRLVNARNPVIEDSQQRIDYLNSRQGQITLELYNLTNDFHQDHNVIQEYPQIAEKMKAFYEQWWMSILPALDIPRPIVIGNKADNPTLLAPSAWMETYFIQKDDVFNGRNANGTWNLRVDASGKYEFALCRWPREAQTPICGSATLKFTDAYTYGPEKIGKALPITKVRIKIGDCDMSLPVGSDDLAVVFKTRLKKGPTQLKTWFYDENGDQLCGAYYVYVTRK